MYIVGQITKEHHLVHVKPIENIDFKTITANVIRLTGKN